MFSLNEKNTAKQQSVPRKVVSLGLSALAVNARGSLPRKGRRTGEGREGYRQFPNGYPLPSTIWELLTALTSNASPVHTFFGCSPTPTPNFERL